MPLTELGTTRVAPGGVSRVKAGTALPRDGLRETAGRDVAATTWARTQPWAGRPGHPCPTRAWPCLTKKSSKHPGHSLARATNQRPPPVLAAQQQYNPVAPATNPRRWTDQGLLAPATIHHATTQHHAPRSCRTHPPDPSPKQQWAPGISLRIIDNRQLSVTKPSGSVTVQATTRAYTRFRPGDVPHRSAQRGTVPPWIFGIWDGGLVSGSGQDPSLRLSLHGPGVTVDDAIEAATATKKLLGEVGKAMGVEGVKWEVASIAFQCDGCGVSRPDRPGPDEGWTHRDGDVFCPACSTSGG